MYLCKRLTKLSYPDIGKNFNNKHHSTVMYSVKQIEEQRRKDPQIDHQVQAFVDHFN
jgi:chromosomal replication initiator protein